MEYAGGGSLADHLDDLDRETGVEVVSSVAEIVHRAHREGAVHGRLHPGNVLFADADRDDVLVSDWLGATARTDLPWGYAAPEQRNGGGGVAADVYQLGTLAAHVLTSDLHSDGEVEDAPDELADVLETALAPDPGERFDSALRFRDMFRWAGLHRW